MGAIGAAAADSGGVGRSSGTQQKFGETAGDVARRRPRGRRGAIVFPTGPAGGGSPHPEAKSRSCGCLALATTPVRCRAPSGGDRIYTLAPLARGAVAPAVGFSADRDRAAVGNRYRPRPCRSPRLGRDGGDRATRRATVVGSDRWGSRAPARAEWGGAEIKSVRRTSGRRADRDADRMTVACRRAITASGGWRATAPWIFDFSPFTEGRIARSRGGARWRWRPKVGRCWACHRSEAWAGWSLTRPRRRGRGRRPINDDWPDGCSGSASRSRGGPCLGRGGRARRAPLAASACWTPPARSRASARSESISPLNQVIHHARWVAAQPYPESCAA